MRKVKILFLAVLSAVTIISAEAEVILANFENDNDKLSINLSLTNSSLFVQVPAIVDNPARQSVNQSNRCLGAINVANADWWQNFVNLRLKSAISITNDNRYLCFKAYRSIQPKMMRIGFNSYETDGLLFQGDLQKPCQWQEVVIDLGANYLGKVLSSLYIVFSCNWRDPRTGWETASYYYDDFVLRSADEMKLVTTIDIDDTHQTIIDFGASDAWLGDYIGRYFDDTMKERAAKLLFSQEFNRGGNPEGIGLSNWRVNLGGGSAEQGDDSGIGDRYRRAESFLAADGVTYDWSKAAGQQYFMQKAKEYGVENILLFSNSAPVQYTKSGKACNSNGEWGANLKTDCYDDFAEYLATVAKHFTDQGYHISYISPVNEPQYDWGGGQEGSPWLNEDIAMLAREIDKSLANRNLSTQILIPEAGAWYFLAGWTSQWGSRACDQIEAFFNPLRRDTYIGNLPHLARAVAGHDYWTFNTNTGVTDDRRWVKEVASKYGIDLFQTEWSMLEDAPVASTGFPADSYSGATYMDIALYMGKLIHCDMVYGNIASWSYWTAFAQECYGQKNRFYLLRVNAAGDGGTESYGSLLNGGSIFDNRNLWVLGNYSRFVRPGYKRVSMYGADDINSLMGSAYLSPDGKQVVAVYVNMGHTTRRVSVNLAGNHKRITSIAKFTTSSTNALTRDRSLPEMYDGRDIQIPLRSVVTLVMNLEDNTSSVIPTLATERESEGNVYSIDGRLVRKNASSLQGLASGIYIYNGKKIIVK